MLAAVTGGLRSNVLSMGNELGLLIPLIGVTRMCVRPEFQSMELTVLAFTVLTTGPLTLLSHSILWSTLPVPQTRYAK